MDNITHSSTTPTPTSWDLATHPHLRLFDHSAAPPLNTWNHHLSQPPPPLFPPHHDVHDHEAHHELEEEAGEEALGAVKEMMYRIAAMQPVDIDPASIKKPRRRNVRISDDPQSVAARHRRERISERIRILQRLVPGGTKMDTASMLDEAIRYIKFLKRQVQELQLQPPPPPPPAVASARPTVSALGQPPAGYRAGAPFFPVFDWAAARPSDARGPTSPLSASSSMGASGGLGFGFGHGMN